MADRKITVKFDGQDAGLKAAADKASRSLKDVGDDGEKHGGRIGTAWDNLKGKFAGNVDDMVGSKGKLGGALSDLGVTGESVMGAALPAAAAAAAVGIGVFVAKSVAGFSELATQTDKLHQVSNLSAQDASRWIEVAGDWGVSADRLTTTFGKLGKAIGATKSGVVRAAGSSRSPTT